MASTPPVLSKPLNFNINIIPVHLMYKLRSKSVLTTSSPPSEKEHKKMV